MEKISISKLRSNGFTANFTENYLEVLSKQKT